MDLSIQMRLYSLSKRHFVLVFIAFLLSFFAIMIIGIAGPTIITTTTVNSSYFSSYSSMATGPFSFFSPALSTFNQQLWLLAQIKITNPTESTYGQDFNMSIAMFAIGQDGSGSSGIAHYRHARALLCKGTEWCEPFVVMHLGHLVYSKFRVKLEFDGLQNTSYDVVDVNFQFKTFNPTFSQFELWFRFAFIIVTFVATCLYAHSLRKYHMRNWTVEQKWMSLLLPLLLLYDDPLFPLSFLMRSWIPGLLDAIFQATFICTLLLFWLCAYHGIRAAHDKRHFVSFYIPKLLICGLFWLAAVTLGCWQQYNELLDPTYQYRVDIKNFIGMKVFFFLMGAVYLLYLGFLLVRACTELYSKPYFNLRLKFLTILNACVVIVSIVIVILRFGDKMIQDNFVAEISIKYKNSAEFVCFYALINLYVYTLCFVYSPAKEPVLDPVFRSGTGFTMLNDSDEEVIYGGIDVNREGEESLLNRDGKFERYDDSDGEEE